MKRYGSFEYDVEAELKRYLSLAERLIPMVKDTVPLLFDAVNSGKQVLVEGANALMLDIDFGTYPYVTSSNCSVGGACTGLALPPQAMKEVIGVVKAYTTRVGGGPFPTEQLNEVGEHLQTVGAEFGVTTGRRRRCGWLDIVVLRYSHMCNHYTALNLTKLDVLDGLDEIRIGVAYVYQGKELKSFPADLDVLQQCEVRYETLSGWKTNISKCRQWSELPKEAQAYVRRIEHLAGVKVRWIGVGVSRDAMIEVTE
jgi:adenylosuccinate synthase